MYGFLDVAMRDRQFALGFDEFQCPDQAHELHMKFNRLDLEMQAKTTPHSVRQRLWENLV